MRTRPSGLRMRYLRRLSGPNRLRLRPWPMNARRRSSSVTTQKLSALKGSGLMHGLMSPKLRGLKPLCLMICLTLGALGLTGCGGKSVQIIIPVSLKEPCRGPSSEAVASLGDLAAFSLDQEAALQACESKRQALVELIDEPESQ